MDNIIMVEERDKYGTKHFYPVNEQASKACRLIRGQKTITPHDITNLKSMGFVVKQVVNVNNKILEVQVL